jgi:hypothetical protein
MHLKGYFYPIVCLRMSGTMYTALSKCNFGGVYINNILP